MPTEIPVAGKAHFLAGANARPYYYWPAPTRARIIKRTADAGFEVVGRNPKIEIALELERIALEDDYLVSRSIRTSTFTPGLSIRQWGLSQKCSRFYLLFHALPAGWRTGKK